ncbi:MAG: oxidoreductase [Bacteroidetes bacterium]|nr:MAG: oxidoreductase [Bacteroidota bacterium]
MDIKRYKPYIIAVGFLAVFQYGTAQQLTILDSTGTTSLRGISTLNANTFWASGNQGTVVHSLNGGKTLNWQTVKGHEKRDFRSVVALSAGTALIMAVDNPALILKTTDTGRTWKTVYEKNKPGMFLDAMAFDDPEHGYCVGDPIDGRFWIIETLDSGNTWAEYPLLERPEAKPGEALFASSGSNIQFVNQQDYGWGFVTGGLTSRLILMGNNILIPPKATQLGLVQGMQSKGANSWAANGKNWMIVGGNYAAPLEDSGNACISTSAGSSWITVPKTLGYKSSVANWKNGYLCCGTSGVAVCNQQGNAWKRVSKTPFHACATTADGKVAYLVGPKGSVAKLVQ